MSNKNKGKAPTYGESQERPTKCRTLSSYFGHGVGNVSSQNWEATSSQEDFQDSQLEAEPT